MAAHWTFSLGQYMLEYTRTGTPFWDHISSSMPENVHEMPVWAQPMAFTEAMQCMPISSAGYRLPRFCICLFFDPATFLYAD